jgi:methionine synthase I (cobalamin-dependent)
MQQEYSEIAQALLPYVDVFLAETLSTVAEAHAALQATAQLGERLHAKNVACVSCCVVRNSGRYV